MMNADRVYMLCAGLWGTWHCTEERRTHQRLCSRFEEEEDWRGDWWRCHPGTVAPWGYYCPCQVSMAVIFFVVMTHSFAIEAYVPSLFQCVCFSRAAEFTTCSILGLIFYFPCRRNNIEGMKGYRVSFEWHWHSGADKIAKVLKSTWHDI